MPMTMSTLPIMFDAKIVILRKGYGNIGLIMHRKP